MKNVCKRKETFSQNCNKQNHSAGYACELRSGTIPLVMATLPKILARLSQMSWDEVRTRTQQSAAKRIDLLKCRLGLPLTNANRNHISSQSGQFFFSAED